MIRNISQMLEILWIDAWRFHRNQRHYVPTLLIECSGWRTSGRTTLRRVFVRRGLKAERENIICVRRERIYIWSFITELGLQKWFENSQHEKKRKKYEFSLVSQNDVFMAAVIWLQDVLKRFNQPQTPSSF